MDGIGDGRPAPVASDEEHRDPGRVPPYRNISYKSCAHFGMAPILDEDTCAAAVRHLQLAHEVAFTDWEADRPEGCYIRSGGIAVLAPNPGNRGNGADMSDPDATRGQVCKQAEPSGECSKEGQNCLVTKCCADPRSACYEKNAAWASCLAGCAAGVHEADPEGYRTAWTCKRLGGPPLSPNMYTSPSLFCFALVVLGYEVELVREQFRRDAGIFGCNSWTVYSNQDFSLGERSGRQAGVTVLSGDFGVKVGGMYNTALNTEVFVRVWKAVFRDGGPWGADWTAKVDVDTVFLPMRLRQRLAELDASRAWQLSNCHYGNHGPLEVISKPAAAAFSAGISLCEQWLRQEFKDFGEDVFERHCLRKLGVARHDAFDLLSEEHCDEQPFPCVADKVAFHPFKNASYHFKCLRQALGEPAAGSSPLEVLRLQAAVTDGNPARLIAAISAARERGVPTGDLLPALSALTGGG